jgi:hypothetical protein
MEFHMHPLSNLNANIWEMMNLDISFHVYQNSSQDWAYLQCNQITVIQANESCYNQDGG